MSSRIAQFEQLVAQQPENELFRFSLAQAFVADGDLEKSLPHYRYCCEKKRDWMMARILLGKALLQLNRRTEAKPALEEALALAVSQAHEDPERELRALLADLR